MVDNTKSKLNLVFLQQINQFQNLSWWKVSNYIDIDLFLNLKCQSFKGSCSFIVMFSAVSPFYITVNGTTFGFEL